MARRIAADVEVGMLHFEHLTKEALRAAFASWADDYAAASVLRAHSSWSSFFDFLVPRIWWKVSPWRRWESFVAKPVLLGPSGILTRPPAGHRSPA